MLLRLHHTKDRPSFLSPIPEWVQARFAALSLMAGAAAGIAFFLFPIPYSFLVVAGLFAAAALLILVRSPLWVMLATLFMALLPIGLIPPEVHSILNRSMVVLALLSFLGCVMTGRCRATWTITTSMMAAFLLWAMFTLSWAKNLDKGTMILFMYSVRFVLFLLLIPSEIQTHLDLNGFMKTLAISGWVLILTSVGVVLSSGYEAGTRLHILQVNENELGILALLAMTGVLWQALRPENQGRWSTRLKTSIYLVLTIVLVAMSGSRGSAISLVIALLAFSVFKPTRSYGLLGLLIIGVAVICIPSVFDTLLQRLAVTEDDTALGGREALWRGGWQLTRESPLFGVGVGNSPFEVLRFLRVDEPDGVDGTPLHNPVLVLWSETGIFGLLIYLSVLLTAIWSFLRQYRLCLKSGVRLLYPYFAIVGAVFLGYMASWIKGGGMETDVCYFLSLALLLIPSSLDTSPGGDMNSRPV